MNEEHLTKQHQQEGSGQQQHIITTLVLSLSQSIHPFMPCLTSSSHTYLVTASKVMFSSLLICIPSLSISLYFANMHRREYYLKITKFNSSHTHIHTEFKFLKKTQTKTCNNHTREKNCIACAGS